jgi:hypothetical protein
LQGAGPIYWGEPGRRKPNEPVEVIAGRHPSPNEMDVYERVLGDTMAGGATLLAREDYFRMNPMFETSSKEYDLVNRTTAAGAGGRLPDSPVYRIFEVL